MSSTSSWGCGYTDSPAKKLVRLDVLETAMRVLGEERFRQGRHLGLASKEAGDLAVLSGLEVDGPCIMAETDREAWLAAKVRWRPNGDIRNEDVLEVAKKEGLFDHINFDTCAPIRRKVVDTVNELAASHLTHGGVITTWFLAGRETEEVIKEIDEMVVLLQDFFTPEMRKKLGREFPLAVLDERMVHIARAVVLEQTVSSYVHLKTGRHMNLVRIWTYISTDYDNKKAGSPMTVVQLQDGEKSKVGFGQQLLAAIKHSHFIVTGDVRRRLTLKAIELLHEDRPAGLLLNSPASVPAWKAHATRGTYGKAAR